MVWSVLLDAVANGPELDCIAQTIEDGGLPETFLDVEVMDAATGTTSWPIWYQEVLGVEVGEDHWPHEMWRCLAPRTAAAVFVTVTLEEFNLAGIPSAEFAGACVKRLPADGDLSRAVSDVMSREHSFGRSEEDWDPFTALLEETVIPGLLSCLEDAESPTADAPPAAEIGDTTGTAETGDADGADASPERSDAPALTVEDVYSQIAPSIPIVRSRYGHSTGILIEGDYVLTNHHVAWPNSFYHTATIVFPDGTQYLDVPVVTTNPWADLAVLGPLETTKKPLTLADGEQLPLGSGLYLIGYPAGSEYSAEPTITRGTLSRVLQWEPYDLTLLQTEAATAGDQSGGVLVDREGRIVGVSAWSLSDAGLGLATSASDDAEIIELMLAGDARYSFSFWDRIDLWAEPSQTWDFELGGFWDAATFFVDERTESIEVEVKGLGDAYLMLASPSDFQMDAGPGDDPVVSGSASINPDEYYFLMASSDSPRAYSVSSSAALLPYYDEDGLPLLLEGGSYFEIAGAFDYYGDIDWYELELREGDTVTIWTDSVLTIRLWSCTTGSPTRWHTTATAAPRARSASG